MQSFKMKRVQITNYKITVIKHSVQIVILCFTEHDLTHLFLLLTLFIQTFSTFLPILHLDLVY